MFLSIKNSFVNVYKKPPVKLQRVNQTTKKNTLKSEYKDNKKKDN